MYDGSVRDSVYPTRLVVKTISAVAEEVAPKLVPEKDGPLRSAMVRGAPPELKWRNLLEIEAFLDSKIAVFLEDRAAKVRHSVV